MKTYTKLIFITLLLLFTSSAQASIPADTADTQQVTFPKLAVTAIEVVTENPEENIGFKIQVTVNNTDNFAYPLAYLSIVATEVGFSRTGEDLPEYELLNQSFSIGANESKELIYIVTVLGGSYTLIGSISILGNLIPTSTFATSLTVLGPPIGEINDLILYVSGIVVFLIIITIIPNIFDLIRVRRKNGKPKK